MKLSKHIRIGVLSVFLLLVVVGSVLAYMKSVSTKDANSFLLGSDITPSMIERDLVLLSSAEQNFEGTRAFFVDIAQKKGGVYAFELLKQAVVPSGTDLHLMGHAVGDELYKQEGLDGMQYCTHDFRNACSHSIVVGALLAEGLDVFDRVNEVCKKAPGGPGAYTMCFHGFGHGVLAFAEYEIPDAIKLCGKVATDAYGREEEAQCIGGMVMEMHQGVHDKEIWERKKDKYLDIKDPLRICQSEYMPDTAKVLCYSYITPFIFDAAGARGGNPSPEIYPKSFTFCDNIKNDTHRQSCYGGLGKEFIVLSQDRDIRKIEDTPDELLMVSASWCSLAEREEAEIACLMSILDSLYWGGENDPEVSVRYCSLVESEAAKNACFKRLFNITQYYQKDVPVKERICELVPKIYKNECTETIL